MRLKLSVGIGSKGLDSMSYTMCASSRFGVSSSLRRKESGVNNNEQLRLYDALVSEPKVHRR